MSHAHHHMQACDGALDPPARLPEGLSSRAGFHLSLKIGRLDIDTNYHAGPVGLVGPMSMSDGCMDDAGCRMQELPLDLASLAFDCEAAIA
jgi:hypothetical protein